MKSFFKDYWEMCLKPSGKWIKKHWKGYLVYIIICFFGGVGIGIFKEKKLEKESEKFSGMKEDM